jgi:hypothetical protein
MKVIKHKDRWYLQSDTGYKEILLSTDTDLIADGVQAIEDDFLEWFVKNPSCESVEVKIEFIQTPDNLKDGFYYKIIIPQEEPKSSCPKCRTTDFDNCHSIHCPMRKEELKQETLEDAAENDFNILQEENPIVPDNHIWPFKLGYLKGAKWQQERMYSEEEVINAFNEGQALNVRGKLIKGKEWFEQFKKK